VHEGAGLVLHPYGDNHGLRTYQRKLVGVVVER
jgi:hypothetical protein